LPARSRGHVTFAIFNRLIKVTAAMARLWQQVLDRVPGSKLAVLASPGEGGVRAAADLLIRYGIDAGRVIGLPRLPRRQYLELYAQVDIALDTFPYAGMTTTCDSLWMGVPTVTLAGPSSVSRTGQSLLNAAGLPELVAQSGEQYVGIAASLAADLSSLSNSRATLRQQLVASPLGDAGRVARGLENAYYGVFQS
jgi:predicted O-linked N-acetylglucosamine transferase (SPINDLY family)